MGEHQAEAGIGAGAGSEDRELLLQALTRLVGERALWHISDRASGALIEFGRRVPLERPVANPHPTDEQRHFEGEQSLFVQCTWRVVAPETVRGDLSWATSYEKWNHELDLVVGASVAAASLGDALDLELSFDNEVSLLIEPSVRGDKSTTYTVRCGTEYVKASGAGIITTSARRGS